MAEADRTAPTATAVATVFPAPGAAAVVPGSADDDPENVTPKDHGRSTPASDQAVAAAPAGLTSGTALVDEARGVRTRATTHGRANNEQASALLSTRECSTAFGGPEASMGTTVVPGVAGAATATVAAAVAAAVAISGKRSMSSVTEPNKRQCVSPAVQSGRRETMAGGKVDAMPCPPPAVQGVPTARKAAFSGSVVSKESFQGAPADGTSEFLSQVEKRNLFCWVKLRIGGTRCFETL